MVRIQTLLVGKEQHARSWEEAFSERWTRTASPLDCLPQAPRVSAQRLRLAGNFSIIYIRARSVKDSE